MLSLIPCIQRVSVCSNYWLFVVTLLDLRISTLNNIPLSRHDLAHGSQSHRSLSPTRVLIASTPFSRLYAAGNTLRCWSSFRPFRRALSNVKFQVHKHTVASTDGYVQCYDTNNIRCWSIPNLSRFCRYTRSAQGCLQRPQRAVVLCVHLQDTPCQLLQHGLKNISDRPSSRQLIS